MKRPAYDQTSLPNCKDCGIELDKEKLKGNLCMKCLCKKGAERRKAKRHAAVEMLGNKCADCEQVYPECVYDFHHIDPAEKDGSVSKMIHSGKRLEVILNEASKCELLCANCHRLRHFT